MKAVLWRLWDGAHPPARISSALCGRLPFKWRWKRSVKLVRHGADLLGLCPFHDDHEPSLVVNPEASLLHCPGARQKGGSVINWIMRRHGVSFRHAAELLRNERPSLATPVRAPEARPGGPPVLFAIPRTAAASTS